MEKIMETSVYRAAIEYLAESRGLTAEELADRAHNADPDFTREELLDGPRSGFGPVLDDALGGLSEAERKLITHAFARTFLGTGRRAHDEPPADWRTAPRSEMFSRVIVAVDAAAGEAVEEGDHAYVRYCEEQLFPFLETEKARAEVLEILREAASAGE